jgi:hypothetical protein
VTFELRLSHHHLMDDDGSKSRRWTGSSRLFTAFTEDLLK